MEDRRLKNPREVSQKFGGGGCRGGQKVGSSKNVRHTQI